MRMGNTYDTNKDPVSIMLKFAHGALETGEVNAILLEVQAVLQRNPVCAGKIWIEAREGYDWICAW